MQTESVAIEIHEIFVSYCLRRFYNRDGIIYGDIVGY